VPAVMAFVGFLLEPLITVNFNTFHLDLLYVSLR
jgi:hypothetical protein